MVKHDSNVDAERPGFKTQYRLWPVAPSAAEARDASLERDVALCADTSHIGPLLLGLGTLRKAIPASRAELTLVSRYAMGPARDRMASNNRECEETCGRTADE
jgi:hypothetical protein